MKTNFEKFSVSDEDQIMKTGKGTREKTVSYQKKHQHGITKYN